MSITVMNPVITDPATGAEFQRVENANGFDYYAIWDARTNSWVEGMWVRVPDHNTDGEAVLDAFYRGETVSSL